MMELPGSFSGMVSSPMPARGPEASQRTSFAILVSEAASGLEGAVRVHHRVVAGQRLELVGRGHERMSHQVRELLRDAHPELGMGVEAGADGGAAQGQLAQMGERGVEVLEPVVELGDVARELLAQGERRRVLQVGAADLHDVAELVGLPLQRVAQALHGRTDVLADGLDGGHVHGGGEDVVGGLPQVDVVVGVDESPLAARPAQELAGPVGQHLVHVHVALGAAARLPDHERELVGVFFVPHLVRRGHDGPPLLLVQQAELHVDERARLFDEGQGADEPGRHALAGDLEVLQGALGLGAPEAVRGHFDGPEGVFLHPRRRGHGLSTTRHSMLTGRGPQRAAGAARIRRSSSALIRARAPAARGSSIRFVIS
jgi:hypothetical protein